LSQEISLGNRIIGPTKPAYIIAEAGSNHNGNIQNAKLLIDIASEAGADAVKFQSFKADCIASRYNPAYEIFKKNELPREWHKELFEYAAKKGLHFISTPFDLDTADFLYDLGVPAFKVASGDITYLQLLQHLGRLGRPVLLSTGKSTLGEIEKALEILATDKVILLHCVASYPASYTEMNLRAIQTLQGAFPGCLTGFSDHTLDGICALGALSLGARVVEKHITFNRHAEGPDHSFAMEREQFMAYVQQIRALETALGDGYKKPTPQEKETLGKGRRSIHAAVDISKGTVITEAHLKIVRPGNGISPDHLPSIVGSVAAVDIPEDTMIKWSHLKKNRI